MSIQYNKLFELLKQKGINTTTIRRENIIGQSAWQKIRTGNGEVDTRTIAKLCKKLECQPGDIMGYVDDNSDTDNEVEL